MKPKPAPKKELIVTVSNTTKDRGGIIAIWFASEDAKNWAEENAPKFGALYKNPSSWVLFTHAAYDTQEVADYLDSYNDEEG